MATRQELYEIVWSTPMTEVAKQFGVSGSYLARICTLLNVPRPHRGYWAKLAVGRAPKPTPLPDPRPGDQTYWSRDGKMSAANPPPPLVAAKPKRKWQRKALAAPGVHDLIHRGRPAFEEVFSADPEAYLRPGKRLMVDLTTSQACLDKSLHFANELFRALTAAGHRVIVAPAEEPFHRADMDEREVIQPLRPHYYPRLWYPWRPTVVYVGTVAIGLTLVEMSEEVLMRYVAGKYVREADYVPPKPTRRRYSEPVTWTSERPLPSGRLKLIAYSPYRSVHWSAEWRETKKKTLEPSIRAIVTALEEAAIELVDKLEVRRREAEVAHREFLEHQERQRREEDRRLVAKSIKDSRDSLDKVIRDWSRVMNVERFLAGVEQEAATMPDQIRDLVQERLKLAREFLGTQNPLAFFLSWKTPLQLHKPVYPDSTINSGDSPDEEL